MAAKTVRSKPRGSSANLGPLKAKVLALIAQGETVANSMRSVDRSTKTWETWKRTDPDFRAAVLAARGQRAEVPEGEFPSFFDFSEEFLDAHVFPHMRNVVDVMEGRDPFLVA